MYLREAVAGQYALVSLAFRLHRLDLLEDRYLRDVVLDRVLQSLVRALPASFGLITFHVEFRACLTVRIASFVKERSQRLILRLSTEAVQTDADQRRKQQRGEEQQQTDCGQRQTEGSDLVKNLREFHVRKKFRDKIREL